MQVERQVNLRLTGQGSTKSMCMWRNLVSGGWKCPRGARMWRCVLERWHSRQSCNQAEIDRLIFDQKKRAKISFIVTTMLRCDSECKNSTTVRFRNEGSKWPVRNITKNDSLRKQAEADVQTFNWRTVVKRQIESLRRIDQWPWQPNQSKQETSMHQQIGKIRRR